MSNARRADLIAASDIISKKIENTNDRVEFRTLIEAIISNTAISSDHNHISHLRQFLRKQLEKETAATKDLCDVIFKLQCTLTRHWPVNQLDDDGQPMDMISLDTIPANRQIICSNGNIYDQEELIAYYRRSNNLHIDENKTVSFKIPPAGTYLSEREITSFRQQNPRLLPQIDQYLIDLLYDVNITLKNLRAVIEIPDDGFTHNKKLKQVFWRSMTQTSQTLAAWMINIGPYIAPWLSFVENVMFVLILRITVTKLLKGDFSLVNAASHFTALNALGTYLMLGIYIGPSLGAFASAAFLPFFAITVTGLVAQCVKKDGFFDVLELARRPLHGLFFLATLPIGAVSGLISSLIHYKNPHDYHRSHIQSLLDESIQQQFGNLVNQHPPENAAELNQIARQQHRAQQQHRNPPAQHNAPAQEQTPWSVAFFNRRPIDPPYTSAHQPAINAQLQR